jgi:hypothetical protein
MTIEIIKETVSEDEVWYLVTVDGYSEAAKRTEKEAKAVVDKLIKQKEMALPARETIYTIEI